MKNNRYQSIEITALNKSYSVVSTNQRPFAPVKILQARK